MPSKIRSNWKPSRRCATMATRRSRSGKRRSKPCLADAYFMGIARWSDFHQVVDRRKFPALDRLYARMLDDPAVRFAHAIEHEEPAQSSGGFQGHVSLEDVLGQMQQAA